MKTLDQHVKPLGKKVQSKKLYTKDATQKKVESKIMLNPITKKKEMAKVTTTVEITVEGTAQAFRGRSK